MESLLFYIQKAETAASDINATYEPDTLTFLQKLYKWKHPHVSTYQGEKACIVLIRPTEKGKRPDGPLVRQMWISTYKAHREAGEWVYRDNFEHMAKLIKALSITQEEGNYNIFIAYNTFIFNSKKKKYTRTQDRAFRSQAIGIDLDFYHVPAYEGLTYEEAIAKIEKDHKDIFKKYDPMIIKSGGGCQLYFLNCKPITFFDTQGKYPEQIKEEIHTFKELSKYFNEQFIDAGADAKCKGDTARIFRPPGVHSVKYEKPVKVVLTSPGRTHSFRDIDIPPMPQRPQVKEPPQEPQKPVKPVKPVKGARSYKGINGIEPTLDNEFFHYNKPYEDIVERRLSDLDTILNTTNNLTGFRELYLFVYCILLKGHKDIEQIQYILCSKNRMFSEPLPQPEIDNIIRQVLSKPYKVSNQYILKTLIEPLSIDTKFLEGHYTDEQKKAANRTKSNKHYEKKSKKSFSKQEKIDYIKDHANMSNKDIAEVLQCSKRSIERLRKAAIKPLSFSFDWSDIFLTTYLSIDQFCIGIINRIY